MDVAGSSASRSLYQLAIECGEAIAIGGRRQMQRIGKIHTGFDQAEGTGNSDRVFDMYGGLAEQSAERGQYCGYRQPVGAAQHPFSLQQDRQADPDVLAIDQRSRAGGLRGMVGGEIAYDDVSIDRLHGEPAPLL